jgi:hypothetical protein
VYTKSLTSSIAAAIAAGLRSYDAHSSSALATSYKLSSMMPLSLQTAAPAARSTSSGAVQRPLKPGDAFSYTSLQVVTRRGRQQRQVRVACLTAHACD